MTQTPELPAQTLPDGVPDDSRPLRTTRVHRAWSVAAAAFVTLIGAAGFASLPGLLIEPLNGEFGWSRGMIGLAVSVNLALYGVTAPFAAALMDRFGIRRVVAAALLTIATGAGLTVFMTASWQLVILWGVLVGLGSGSMALAFATTVTNRWFEDRRGLVTGILTAAGAAGQLIFLPCSPSSSSTRAGAPRRSPSRARRSSSHPWSTCCCGTTRPTWAWPRTAPRSSCRSRRR